MKENQNIISLLLLMSLKIVIKFEEIFKLQNDNTCQ
jgi:hypothetical protein